MSPNSYDQSCKKNTNNKINKSLLAKCYCYLEQQACWLQQSSTLPNALDTHASDFSLPKGRQKKGERMFSFVYFRGNFSVLLHQKSHCSFVVHIQCRAHDKFPLKNPVYMTDNSKATNYRNFMPPAASGIKHSFQPCFYLLNLDKFMLLITVKKTLRCRNCIPRHKNNLELNIL